MNIIIPIMKHELQLKPNISFRIIILLLLWYYFRIIICYNYTMHSFCFIVRLGFHSCNDLQYEEQRYQGCCFQVGL